MSWQLLEDQQPELAAFRVERLNGQVAYLATVRRDGSPRVHPMTPIIGLGHLFVFMEATSPKGHDLRRDGRYAIHGAVSDNNGAGGEFFVTGQAHLVSDPELSRCWPRSFPATSRPSATSCSNSTLRAQDRRSTRIKVRTADFGSATLNLTRGKQHGQQTSNTSNYRRIHRRLSAKRAGDPAEGANDHP